MWILFYVIWRCVCYFLSQLLSALHPFFICRWTRSCNSWKHQRRSSFKLQSLVWRVAAWSNTCSVLFVGYRSHVISLMTRQGKQILLVSQKGRKNFGSHLNILIFEQACIIRWIAVAFKVETCGAHQLEQSSSFGMATSNALSRRFSLLRSMASCNGCDGLVNAPSGLFVDFWNGRSQFLHHHHRDFFQWFLDSHCGVT